MADRTEEKTLEEALWKMTLKHQRSVCETFRNWSQSIAPFWIPSTPTPNFTHQLPRSSSPACSRALLRPLYGLKNIFLSAFESKKKKFNA